MSTARLTLVHAKYSLIETTRIPIALIGTVVFPTLSLLFFVVPQRVVAENPAGNGVQREENTGIACAEEPAALRIQIQPVRSCSGHVEFARHAKSRTPGQHHDLRRLHDVYVEPVTMAVINGPARAARHGDVRDALLADNVDDRYGKCSCDRWIADIRSDQDVAPGIDSRSRPA